MKKGKIYRISGPVVVAEGFEAKMNELVRVGKEGLMGEVVQMIKDKVVIQVYEDTTGLKPGENIEGTGKPLSVELGPGLLSQIYNGVQGPLPELRVISGDFIKRGIHAPALNQKKRWEFKAKMKTGDFVSGGYVLGTVQETKYIEHKILVPPNVKGKIKKINSGTFSVSEPIGYLEDKTPLFLSHKWPIREPRPYKEELFPEAPLITGQRILDSLFPITKGGTAAMPGPFGSGKTVTQQSLAKWSDADIIVFVGCGERGNEMTEILTEFPHLIDPKTGALLMERTVIIANTSNMPVAAREASVYTGITIAEYFRDQGFDVALMADSTSRWAEALREISSRLEEMPGEEGYPAYLAARLSEFYERAGRVVCLGSDDKRIGSISVIGAISPPGGDFSEPVTQNTLKITKVFWALDSKLAQRRHFPAINWLDSYSTYEDALSNWYADNVSIDFVDVKNKVMMLLQEEANLQEIVQLIGSDALPEKERILLEVARMIREGFLQQNAFDEIDSYCSLKKQYEILKFMIKFYELALNSVKAGVDFLSIVSLESKTKLAKMKFIPESDFEKEMKRIDEQMINEFQNLRKVTI